jgi:hypothetical protein
MQKYIFLVYAGVDRGMYGSGGEVQTEINIATANHCCNNIIVQLY